MAMFRIQSDVERRQQQNVFEGIACELWNNSDHHQQQQKQQKIIIFNNNPVDISWWRAHIEIDLGILCARVPHLYNTQYVIYIIAHLAIKLVIKVTFTSKMFRPKA